LDNSSIRREKSTRKNLFSLINGQSVGYGKDRLWIERYGDEFLTFGDLWFPSPFVLLIRRIDSVFDSFSCGCRPVKSKITSPEWRNHRQKEIFSGDFKLLAGSK